MIKEKWMPVVDVSDIEAELRVKGVDRKYADNVRNMLFDDQYINDVYVSYYIADDVCEEYYCDKEETKVIQMVLDMLREVYPNSDRVLVDVSW